MLPVHHTPLGGLSVVPVVSVCDCRGMPRGRCPPALCRPRTRRATGVTPPNHHGGIQPPDLLDQVPQAATRAATRSCIPAPRCPRTPLRCRAAVVPCGAGSLPRLGTHEGCSGPSFPPSSPLRPHLLCLKSLLPSLSLSFSVPAFSPLPVPLSVLAPVLSALLRSLPGRPLSPAAGTASPARALGPHVPGRAGRGHRGSQVGWGRL